MKAYLIALHNKALAYLVLHKEGIKYEISSVAKSFLSGFGLYVIANHSTFQFEKASIIGLILAAARSGVKVLWAFIAPQLVALFKSWNK